MHRPRPSASPEASPDPRAHELTPSDLDSIGGGFRYTGEVDENGQPIDKEAFEKSVHAYQELSPLYKPPLVRPRDDS